MYMYIYTHTPLNCRMQGKYPVTQLAAPLLLQRSLCALPVQDILTEHCTSRAFKHTQPSLLASAPTAHQNPRVTDGKTWEG